MGTVVRFEAPRTVSLVEEPDPPLAPDEVRLRTLYSGISAGTELTAYRGSNPYLNKRWDHNRVQVVCSQISGVAPALSYRWDALRLSRTVMDLAVSGRLELRRFVSHVLPFGQAGQAFELLDRTPEQALQVVLEGRTN